MLKIKKFINRNVQIDLETHVTLFTQNYQIFDKFYYQYKK